MHGFYYDFQNTFSAKVCYCILSDQTLSLPFICGVVLFLWMFYYDNAIKTQLRSRIFKLPVLFKSLQIRAQTLIPQNRFLVSINFARNRFSEGERQVSRTKSIPASKLTVMVHGLLDSILGSYLIPGIDMHSLKYRH
jgi:hypothetical protein